jgi:hypothetical protein
LHFAPDIPGEGDVVVLGPSIDLVELGHST